MTFISKLFGHSDLIYIHTDKQQYYAGECVTGQIILSVVKPLQIDAVYLVLEGHEETSFMVRVQSFSSASSSPSFGNVRNPHQPGKSFKDSSTNIHYVDKEVSQKKIFFRRKYRLYAQKSVLNPGNFVFPFQFTLDPKLPGTFEICNKSHFPSSTQALVWYSVGAEIAIPGILTPNLRHCQDLLVCEPLRSAMMTTETFKETNVTFLCCIPKGTVSMSATIDKNAYGPGDTVNVRLVVDNSLSKVNLEYLSLKLTSSTTLHAEGEKFYQSKTIAKARSFGINAGDRADRYIQLTLPSDIEPSTKSTLIECSYVLSVELKVPWSPDVVIAQPVQIYAPLQTTFIAQLQYPPNWSPSVFPVADLQTMQYISY